MSGTNNVTDTSDVESHHVDSAVLGVGFGSVQYSIEERQFLQSELEQKLDEDMIAKRDGPSGTKVHYIETWKAIAQTNRLFGFNGWSSRIMEINLDYIDQVNGRFTAGVSAIVRITLKDGSFREDIGYGVSENQKQKGKALEQGKKKAVSDALKRALKGFGHALGLSVYDKDHIKDVEKKARLKTMSGGANRPPTEIAPKSVNPHFTQTPGSPPKHQFAPVSSPPQGLGSTPPQLLTRTTPGTQQQNGSPATQSTTQTTTQQPTQNTPPKSEPTQNTTSSSPPAPRFTPQPFKAQLPPARLNQPQVPQQPANQNQQQQQPLQPLQPNHPQNANRQFTPQAQPAQSNLVNNQSAPRAPQFKPVAPRQANPPVQQQQQQGLKRPFPQTANTLPESKRPRTEL